MSGGVAELVALANPLDPCATQHWSKPLFESREATSSYPLLNEVAQFINIPSGLVGVHSMLACSRMLRAWLLIYEVRSA